MQAEQLTGFAWTFDVVHPDPERRQTALETERMYQAEWSRLSSQARVVHQRVAEHDQLSAAMRDAYDLMFAAPIWHYMTSDATPAELAPFARHAVLYLRWETEFPDEWAEHAKSWTAKRLILRALAAHGPTPQTHGDLLALVDAAVRREHRCEDLGYVKVARTLHEPSVRWLIEAALGHPDPLTGLRAGYLAWALDHPAAPVTPASWRAWLRS
ncbi:hypothetical protein QEZ54_10475 [Catellatospora sp. KI3]|uniref:hypothetical protein n=1 Tax=Catellatospora sp. KI3 TaxID=3041620 RepID=UPI0024826C10|nr:hypothetical protein [Catellatospora sp. KI3]MDI1461394.1 hypothetical protein [Catellatospora sp. KI3]